MPAEKHSYATPKDVELSPLLLHQMAALFSERSAAPGFITLPIDIMIEACRRSSSSTSSTVAFPDCRCHIEL